MKTTARPAGPAGVAGLELRVAMTLLQDEEAAVGADNIFWPKKCRSLFLRPATEPIACSYWRRFAGCEIDEAAALNIASALAGRKLVYRKGPAVGKSPKGNVGFEPLEVASLWLSKICDAWTRDDLLPGLPIYAFAQTIMTHPFSDGNGRFARLMVNAALARCAGLEQPEIALAPSFYRRGEGLAVALHALSDDQEWSPLVSVFLSVLEEAVSLTQALHSRAR